MARPGVDTLIAQFGCYLRRQTYSPETVRHYSSALHSVVAFVKKAIHRPLKLKDLTRRRLQEWLDGLADAGLAASTLGVKRAALVCFFDYLAGDDRIREDQDPTKRLRTPPIKKRRQEVLAHAAAMAIISEPLAHAAGGAPPSILALRDHAMQSLLYEGELRVSEVAGLRLGDLVWDEPRPGYLVLKVMGKGTKPRDVPVRYSLAALRTYLARRQEMRPGEGEDWVFINFATGGRITGGAISSRVRYYSRRAGYPTHAHVLRHSGATHSMRRGAQMPALQDNLGHDHMTTTRIYTATNADYLVDNALHFHPVNEDVLEEQKRAAEEKDSARLEALADRVAARVAAPLLVKIDRLEAQLAHFTGERRALALAA